VSASLKGRGLAFVAGLAFAIGGLTILLDRDLTSPAHWQSGQWLTILTVFGTITAGHLMADAFRARHYIAALGFLVLFLSGTTLVVYSSVGRQAEQQGVTTMSVEDTNTKIAEKNADLESAKQRKAYADGQVQKEMTHSYCGRNCKDWQRNSQDVAIVIAQLEKDIASLGPQRPVNAQAAAMAEVALLFHAPGTKDQIVAALVLLIPFAKTLFFEIGSIVALGFAFRQGKRPIIVAANDCFSVAEQKQTVASSVAIQLPEPPMPPKGKRKSQLPEGVVQLRNHPVFKALQANGGSVTSHRQLSQLLGIDEGAATRRRQEVEEHLTMERRGKQLRIALKSA
jgi:hypothetical protein